MSEPHADEEAPPGTSPGDTSPGAISPGGATPPTYKGAPLDGERGPGLGCFWTQIVLLVTLLIATPLSVVLVFPPWVSAAMLILTLVLLFFAGQTTIFLLRLVAADRRSQRRPLREGARPTVGQLENGPDSAAPPRSDEDDA